MKARDSKNQRRRRRVLLSAYACEPKKGSEPEAGWQWSVQLTKWYDVTVITRTNNRKDIEAALATCPPPHPEFIYYDLPRWILACKRIGLLPLPCYYVLWQIGVRWKLRRQLAAFDLVHHVTFNAFRWPGVWWRCPVPILLGPLGGGQACPWRLLPLFGTRFFSELLRSIAVAAAPLSPFHHLTCRAATRIIIANEDTLARIPRKYRHKTTRMLDAGIDSALCAFAEGSRQKSGKQFLWAGRLEKRKAPHLALLAFAKAAKKDHGLRLTFVGDGPEAAVLKQKAARLGVRHLITWTGSISRADLQQLMLEHDGFLFTSLRDTSGYVVLEAMAAQLPVITLDHQGAAEMTTADCAIRVPISRASQMEMRLADAILQLARSRELRQRLGKLGRERVTSDYLWEHKAERMRAIYNEILERQSPQQKSLQPAVERDDG